MSEGVSIETSPCPSCGAAMTPGAVVCIACGFNATTGAKAASAGGDVSTMPRRTEVLAAEDEGWPSMGQRIVKLVIALAVLGALGGAGWYIRGAIKHNPGAEAKETLAKIQNGMNPEEVVAMVERPPRETWTTEDPPEGSQSLMPKEVRLPYVENYFKTHGAERLKYGFVFIWRFSERAQLHVHFDEEGKVASSEIVDRMKALGM